MEEAVDLPEVARESFCTSEFDFHDEILTSKVFEIIKTTDINVAAFFKHVKSINRYEQEQFNLLLQKCHEQKMEMSDAFLILCREFIEIEKAKNILTEHNLSIIKAEMIKKHHLRGIETNSLNTFF